MRALAEVEVQAALRAEVLASRPSGDLVDRTLQELLEPDKCPKCKVPYQVCMRTPPPPRHTLHFLKCHFPQHFGGCAAMHCSNCRAHFCLWCRKVIVADDKNKDAGANTHAHVFDCVKAPDICDLLSSSRLFPINTDDENSFVACYFQIRRLESVTMQMSLSQGSGWTSEDCKRLVLHRDFQGLLVHLKEQRAIFRAKYPDKPELLRMPFNNTVGLDDSFDFDNTGLSPAWQNCDEEGDAERRDARFGAMRARLRASAAARTATPAPFVVQVESLQTLVDMGFDRQQATRALESSNGNLEAAIALLV